jgi:hypothetical protein
MVCAAAGAYLDACVHAATTGSTSSFSSCARRAICPPRLDVGDAPTHPWWRHASRDRARRGRARPAPAALRAQASPLFQDHMERVTPAGWVADGARPRAHAPRPLQAAGPTHTRLRRRGRATPSAVGVRQCEERRNARSSGEDVLTSSWSDLSMPTERQAGPRTSQDPARLSPTRD